MKITFDGKELTWLHTYVTSLIELSKKRDDLASKLLYRQASKLKYKFTGNVCYVSLTRSERDLLCSLAVHRLKMIQNENLLAEDHETVQSLINKTKE
jgi:hypothetical protein